MKTKQITLLILTCSFLFSCRSNREGYIQEIRETEEAFARMAAEKGIAEAFTFYVADSGIVNRRDSLIKGKEAVMRHYSSWKAKDVTLKWSPYFIDVSASGDLGYTYGRYVFTIVDSTGTKKESTGIFHTVWKRQADGTWRFVWD